MARSFSLGLAGFVALLLACELLFRLLPVSTATMTGYYIDAAIVTYPAGHHWTVSTGWDLRNVQRLVANNLGFVADGDFTPDKDAIGLVGDSYVEAGMLAKPDRPAKQLAQALGGRQAVYAFGGPGSALLDYAERIRYASQHLGVRDFVVMMEAGDVRQSLCGSGNVHSPCLDRDTLQPRNEPLAEPLLAKRLLRRSALAQYIVGQLKVSLSRLPAQLFPAGSAVHVADGPSPPTAGGETPQQAARRAAMVQTVAQAFFDRIAPYAVGKLVVVIDGRRGRDDLRSDSAALAPLMRERDAFMAIASERGATVIDAEPLYLRHWQMSGRALSVGPHDGHLNREGVGLVMRATAEAMQ